MIINIICVDKMVVSTGIVENMTYAGQVYYEEKRAKELVTFTAAKKLSALIEVHHIYIQIHFHVNIHFYSSLRRNTYKLRLINMFIFHSILLIHILN